MSLRKTEIYSCVPWAFKKEPKMMQLDCKLNNEEQNDLDSARISLLKEIHRYPECQNSYLKLFKIELSSCFETEDKSLDVCIEYEADDSIQNSIKAEIWYNRNNNMPVWSYIASKELEGVHWEGVEEFCDDESGYSNELKYFIGTYKEALNQFSDVTLCDNYMLGLLRASESVCTDSEKIAAVKEAWLYGLDKDVLSSCMYEFGFLLIDIEDEEECMYLMNQFK